MYIIDFIYATQREVVGLTPNLSFKRPRRPQKRKCGVSVSLHKILFHFRALLWESIILLLPPPTCKAYPIAILLHGHCAIYAHPPTSPLNTILHTIWGMAISCEGRCEYML